MTSFALSAIYLRIVLLFSTNRLYLHKSEGVATYNKMQAYLQLFCG